MAGRSRAKVAASPFGALRVIYVRPKRRTLPPRLPLPGLKAFSSGRNWLVWQFVAAATDRRDQYRLATDLLFGSSLPTLMERPAGDARTARKQHSCKTRAR